MRPKRADVISAARTFVQSSNDRDEMFVVNFNEHVSFGLPEDMPFTNKITPMQLAIERSPISGQTALYDAVSVALDRLKLGKHDKKVLIVISDGGDNASKHSNLKQIMTQAVESNAVIYAIGLFDESDVDRNPGVLKQLARATGGEFFQPEKIDDVIPLCAQIARDIRNQYTIAYTPTNAAADGAYRAIQVKAKAPGFNRLTVRTRPGYYAPGEKPPSTSAKSSTPKSALAPSAPLHLSTAHSEVQHCPLSLRFASSTVFPPRSPALRSRRCRRQRICLRPQIPGRDPTGSSVGPPRSSCFSLAVSISAITPTPSSTPVFSRTINRASSIKRCRTHTTSRQPRSQQIDLPQTSCATKPQPNSKPAVQTHRISAEHVTHPHRRTGCRSRLQQQ